MKNILRNRTILGIACIVLSLIICFGLTPLYNSAITAKTEVSRVTQTITKGEMITKDMIETIEVGGYNLPDSVLREQSHIIGKYAKSDFYKGDYLMANKLSEGPLVNYAYLYDFNGTERAISVSIKSFAAGLSGKLEPGDIVTVMVSDYGEKKETVSPIELQYVRVLAVTASTGLDTEEYQSTEDGSISNEEKELPSTLTLKVTQEQAKLLAELEAKGKIHAVFVYRGSADNSEAFLTEQKQLLEKQREVELKNQRGLPNQLIEQGMNPDEAGELDADE